MTCSTSVSTFSICQSVICSTLYICIAILLLHPFSPLISPTLILPFAHVRSVIVSKPNIFWAPWSSICRQPVCPSSRQFPATFHRRWSPHRTAPRNSWPEHYVSSSANFLASVTTIGPTMIFFFADYAPLVFFCLLLMMPKVEKNCQIV